MPKLTAKGRVKKGEIPSTVRRSSARAQRTFAKTHDAAAEQYGEGERAHRVAFASLKHNYEKIGDHWERKDEAGPSDERAESGGPNARGEAAEGVYANATKDHLYDIAKELNIGGRSRMNKAELVTAIRKENRKRSREANNRD